MTTSEHEYDVVVAGSGAAALGAAVTAADAGLSVLVLEASERWGGSSAMSGGGVWLPDNPLMRRAGAGDSRAEALEYLEQTVGHAGPATSRARKEAFVDGVTPLVELLERLGLRFARAADYPDYYPELPGGKIGRAIEVHPVDVRRLGPWWSTSRGRSDGVPAPVMTDDFWLLQRAWSTAGGMARGARVAGRVAAMAARREWRVGMGAGLTAALMEVVQRQGTPVWLSSPLEELLVEDGRVVGVRVTRDGRPVTVTASRGVVLAAGGFDHDAELRRRHQGVDGSWSSGAASNLGGAIEAAEKVGAGTDLMDDAWWGGSVPPAGPEDNAGFMVSERSVPYSLIVDASGRRFANESESYVDLGHHMLERRESVPGRFWMVTDRRHARRYLRSYAMDPRVARRMRAAGILHRAPTLAALAERIGVDPAALADTVERFNGFARTGVDHDFGRGNSAYDRYYGDPTVHPNPNLGPLEKGPFTAIEVVPGDLGTKGGVVTDEHARALRPDGSVIPGLYAAGNCSASVMGHTYPGPGSTLGPALVFGHLAARHLAARG
ncbi:FAD-binding protein [Phycicoccus endophyticus]|uniref:3-oxosteroid 1-dehydrogenase n=1 Tax=Phycicoccus endophyticus TaxID=1690220 RepID=A0A7G9R1M5_9MICO|nr:FAD-binding protein [Phycicoccus endophyticus]NHI18711.1 FAD-binding protein [Phycicoccus endophyticus]QNN49500.1 FAD-binding protein [Phycicoccus endophyticus]GGL37044.1 3-oxosteroid 1-dehydrogenase [Phycicoccus endophyticus]